MYASLAALKTLLGIPASNTTRDTELTSVLTVASAQIDRKCGRTFALGEEETRTFPVWSGSVFTDDIASLVSVSPEVTYDTLRHAHDWPITILSVPESLASIEVTARYGWPSVPPEIDQAALLLAHRLWKRAETPVGISGFSSEGQVVRVPWRDPDVELLLAPYRRIAFA